MLKVCLVFDCEGFTSFKQGNPRWNLFEKLKGKVNSSIKGWRYNKDGFRLVYSTILEEKFPATFMLVGKLFKPGKNHNFIEYGYHTLNHLPLTLSDSKTIEKETKNIFNAKSFSPPLWMVEDKKYPDRVFKILEKQGYKAVIYRGLDNGLEHEHHFEISSAKKRGKLKLIHVSNWVEGNSSSSHVKMVLAEIEKNSGKDAVYCITSHDFSHKSARNLKYLIHELKRMEKQGEIKIIKAGEIR